MKKLNRKEKGITLIALVVTIVVLLILAGVNIAMLTGENGIIKQAQRAKDATEKASKEEQQTLEEIEWEMNDIINDDNEPVPEGKYYSIRNGKEKTYYGTFKEAYEASVDNGGKYRGGTIVVEKDVTEELTELIEINKTITIDLKLNTMKRNTSIYVMGGTLTVTGQDSGTKTGTIECTADTILLRMFNDANINVIGNPLMKSVSYVFCTYGESFPRAEYPPEEYKSTGTVNIQGGYIVATERGAIRLEGNGSITINNAKVIAIRNDKNAIVKEKPCSSSIIIEGNSVIANGMVNANTSQSSACNIHGIGNLTLRGNTIVTTGLYGSNALNLYDPLTLNIEDNVRLYSKNSRTILVRANGTTLNINTKGVICCEKNVPIGIDTSVSDVNCNIQSGTFASIIPDPLKQAQPYMDNYPEEGTETRQNIDYYYLDSEDFRILKTKTMQDSYVVKI